MTWIMLMAAIQAASPAPCVSIPVVGTAVALRLDARLPVPPAKAPPAGTFAGTMPLTANTAGTYRIALSRGGWIDLVRGGKALSSTGHGHAAPCSGLAKYVEFRLEPGAYLIELSGAKEPTINVAVSHP